MVADGVVFAATQCTQAPGQVPGEGGLTMLTTTCVADLDGDLRHTFGTHLCRAGVPLRTAQAAMRHSDPSLTANVYTDPKLLDVAGALESLPSLGAVAGRNTSSTRVPSPG